MKIARFQIEKSVYLGQVEGQRLQVLSGELFGALTPTEQFFDLEAVELLAPLTPKKVICIGLNYLAHAQEMQGTLTAEEPVVFLTAPSAVIASGQPIRLVHSDHLNHQEAELVVVMGKTACNVDESEALDYVFGYTIGNDASDRTIQKKDGQWTRSKSFPTYKPLGPWIDTQLDAGHLAISSRINGKTAQSSNTEMMIYSVPKLIAYLSGFMTLDPGDVIYTGTPGGPGEIKAGDLCEIEIEQIGILKNPVQ